MRSGLVLVLVAIAPMYLASTGCMAAVDGEPVDEDVASDELARPGHWHLPDDVRRIGERQFVNYDGAPAWDGGAHCSGHILGGTTTFGRYLELHFPQIDHNGGYNCRPNSALPFLTSMHGTGRALDIMLPMDGGDADNGKGDPIANYLVTHAELIGVQYLIWDHWDWLAELPGRKDTSYSGPNPHIDHVHMELTQEAAHRNTRWFVDHDFDGIRNDHDNCVNVANAEQDDADHDGRGNRCDNCPRDRNGGQADADHDGVGDACDNCLHVDNKGQDDSDRDGRGDRCDNCDTVDNPGQRDTDRDDRGDACDADDDGDGRRDGVDNCPIVPNPEQADSDGDGRGDRCDGDDDGDGVGDGADNCPHRANADQADLNHDGVGDVCDDTDGDRVNDAVDNCPRDPNPAQSDLDEDGIGDACDADADDDGLVGAADSCPEAADPRDTDTDSDGLGDACDPDSDGDGTLNELDVCPGVPDDQTDTDGDDLGDACDPEPLVSRSEPLVYAADDDGSPPGGLDDGTGAGDGVAITTGCNAAPVPVTHTSWAAMIAVFALLGRALSRTRRRRAAPSL